MNGGDGRALLARAGVLVLDAAVGTELSRRGADTRPPLWSARPLTEGGQVLKEIHADDAAAGADVVTAATFRTHRRTLEAAGLPAAAALREADLLTRRAVHLAREGAAQGRAAAGRKGRVLVAGSLSPLEDCYRPDLCPVPDVLERDHPEQAERLAAAGVDLIVVETMNSLAEAVAAARAAAATGVAVVVSFVTDGEGRLLSGESLAEAAAAAVEAADGPLAVGVNCIPARLVEGELSRLAEALPGRPLAAWGNAGRALDEAAGLFAEPIAPDAYAALARRWIELGARIVGGCCGTNATHTAALRKLIDHAPLPSGQAGGGPPVPGLPT